MRNLKRALSLTLASVMLLGMMVVGSSAAGYPDVTEEENIEAIEVLQEVGVMEGDNNGNFNPDDYVTREQMAVIMSKLLNLDYNYYQGTNPFSDVPAWAAPYVAACAANGITSGIGGGMYGAGQNVNAVQAALMMLKALGYFQYQEDFGDSYILATVKQATEVGLFDMIDSNAQSSLTRNEVAQMALNALQSDMVSFTGDVGTKIPTANGDVIVNYRSEYTPRTSTMSKYQAIERRSSDVGGNNNLNRGQYYIQLGEELYNGDLVLHEYSDDDFVRPSRNWEYKGNEIGTYMKKENIRETYTKGVDARTLYDLIGRTNLQEYSFNYYVNGVASDVITADNILQRNKGNYSTTGNGVLTQVFVDIEAETIDITSINTWLAKATSDYNTSRETLNVEIYYDYDDATPKTKTTSETISLQDVDNIKDVKADQYVLVNRSGKDQPSNKLVTVILSEPDTLIDVAISEYSKKGSSNDNNSDVNTKLFDSVVADGTKYNTNYSTYFNADVLDRYNQNLLTDKTYDIYLDKYGYAIGIALHSGEDNYVFITGVNLDDSAISNSTSKAGAIFLDGTSAAIEVNVKDTNKNIKNDTGDSSDYFEEWTSTNYPDATRDVINRWFTYTVDKNGVYTLTPASRMFTTDVNNTDHPTDEFIVKCNSVRLNEVVADAAHDDDNKVYHPTSAEIAAQDGGAKRAYGNDNSVYIIAELDKVSTSGNDKVITGVDAMYTGVQSVEIEVAKHAAGTAIYNGTSDQTKLYDSIYTVYDKDLYVIGSVIIGEAKGSSANYAYILTAATGEKKIGDTYYWTFDAIVDGKIQTLTVESKFNSTVKDLRPGHMQELRYNSSDYVVAVKDIKPIGKYVDNVTTPIVDGTHEVYDVGHDADAWDDYGTEPTVYVADGSHITAPDLKVVGRTLQTGIASEKALTFVSENTPTVVINRLELGKSNVKTEFESVSEALGHLADADETKDGLQFQGRIVAPLDNLGRATWVVIISDTEVKTVSGGSTGGNTSTTKGNITVITDKINAKEIKTSLTKEGNLRIAIPTGDPMWTNGEVNISVNVDGIPMNSKLTTDGKIYDGYLVYTTKDLELSDEKVVVTITGEMSGTVVNSDGSTSLGVTVGNGTTTAQIQDKLDELDGATDAEGNILKGTLNVTGDVDLGDKDIPNNVEVIVAGGKTVTIGDSNAQGVIKGAGNVIITGDVDNAHNIQVDGTITLGTGGSIVGASGGVSSDIGTKDKRVDVVLDGGSVDNGLTVAGNLTIAKDVAVPNSKHITADEIIVNSGVNFTLNCTGDGTGDAGITTQEFTIKAGGKVTYKSGTSMLTVTAKQDIVMNWGKKQINGTISFETSNEGLWVISAISKAYTEGLLTLKVAAAD